MKRLSVLVQVLQRLRYLILKYLKWPSRVYYGIWVALGYLYRRLSVQVAKTKTHAQNPSTTIQTSREPPSMGTIPTYGLDGTHLASHTPREGQLSRTRGQNRSPYPYPTSTESAAMDDISIQVVPPEPVHFSGETHNLVTTPRSSSIALDISRPGTPYSTSSESVVMDDASIRVAPLDPVHFSGETHYLATTPHFSSIALDMLRPGTPRSPRSSSETCYSGPLLNLEGTCNFSERDITRQMYSVKNSSKNGSRHSIVTIEPEISTTGNVAYPGVLRNSSLDIDAVIYPDVPSQLNKKRYDKERKIRTVTELDVVLSPNRTDFSIGDLPHGWEQMIHPEGLPIFYNRSKRIVTESWIWNQDIFNHLDGFVSQFDEFIRVNNLELPQCSQLVLDVTYEKKEEGYWCAYYYVCHSTRSLFWLEKHDISDMFKGAESEVQAPHIQNQLHYQYWLHWDMFPSIQDVTIETLDLLLDYIRDARTDVVTAAAETTILHSEEELSVWTDITKDARDHLRSGSVRQLSGWFVGRFMSSLWRTRFMNFYGQYGARLSRKHSVHGRGTPRRTILIKLLSPMLFSAPNVHLTTMETLWIDKLTLGPPWSDFFARLNEEWQGHTVYASILLNANVAFLAIPMNDPNGNTYVRTANQIASYLSIVTSFTSMLLALLLVRQHRTRKCDTAVAVNTFLIEKNHSTRGLEILAILYSLPYALLVWGMVTFFSAFLIMCFSRSTLVARFIVGVACLLAGALVLWCIWMGWEKIQEHWWWTVIQDCWAMLKPEKGQTDGAGSEPADDTDIGLWDCFRDCFRRRRGTSSNPANP